jgi:hypothetical protein
VNGVEVEGDLTAASGPNADPDSPSSSARDHNPTSVESASLSAPEAVVRAERVQKERQ